MDKVFKPQQIIALLDKLGVRKALLSSLPNENSHKLYDLAPDRFYLGLMPYKNMRMSKDWFYHPSLSIWSKISSRKRNIPTSRWSEFHLTYKLDFDNESVPRLVKLAGDNRLFLHVHTSAAGIKKLFSMAPNMHILWAQRGRAQHRCGSPAFDSQQIDG